MMQDIEQARTQFVKVTNGLPFTIFDRFDGVPYKIIPGGYVNFPLDAARHIFGYTEPADEQAMRMHTCRRMGWNTIDYLEVDPKTKKNKAQTYFEGLTIEPVVYRMVKVDPKDDNLDPQEPIPADPEIPDDSQPRRKPLRHWERGASA